MTENDAIRRRSRVRRRPQLPDETGQQIEMLDVRSIRVGDRLRRVNEDAVSNLADSISRGGLQSPIIVKAEEADGAYRLVSGWHRLNAHKRLGQSHIKAFVTAADDLDCQIMEIDENLMRADLSELEVSEHLARRQKLLEAKGGTTCPTPGGKQRIGFARDTAAKTNRSRRSINRSLRRGNNIAEDVKARIAGSPIANNGVELDALAGAPHVEQRKAVDRVESGAALSIRDALSDKAQDPDEKEFEEIKRRLVKASTNVREWLRVWLNERAQQDTRNASPSDHEDAEGGAPLPDMDYDRTGDQKGDSKLDADSGESDDGFTAQDRSVSNDRALTDQQRPSEPIELKERPRRHRRRTCLAKRNVPSVSAVDIDKMMKNDLVKLEADRNLEIPGFRELTIAEMKRSLKKHLFPKAA